MDILIEELDSNLWTAALKDGQLAGLEVDPALEEVRWGSIYWAKLNNIDAAQDAAFMNLDGYNTGILFNKDTRRTDKKSGVFIKGGEKAIGKTFQPGQMIAVQAKSAYLPKEFDDYARPETKTPQLSMDITLPGRYLIYCPMMNKNRVSMRIKDKAMRKQLLKMMDEMGRAGEELEGDFHGYIMRAAAADTQTDMLVREAVILREAWIEMQPHLEGSEPQLIMLGPDAIQRSLSDHADQQIDTIEVTTIDHFKHAEEWCQVFAPDLMTKINPIELKDALDDLALFHERDIMGQIENLFNAYAFLPGGGNLIIQETAALTSIDVNRGVDKRSKLSVNIEAAQEAARQMKLRNTGGIVVIDFIKMNNKKEQGQLIAALEEAISKDPCTVQIHGLTNLGLMEISRKRRTPPLQDRFSKEQFDEGGL